MKCKGLIKISVKRNFKYPQMSLVVRKLAFCICENKDADQQSLHFLNLKFQASSHLRLMSSPVNVGPGRKPRRPVFSQRGSNETGDNTKFHIFDYMSMETLSCHRSKSNWIMKANNTNNVEANIINIHGKFQFFIPITVSAVSIGLYTDYRSTSRTPYMAAETRGTCPQDSLEYTAMA